MARYDTELQSRMHRPHRHTRDRTIAALYKCYEGCRHEELDDEQVHASKIVSKLCDCGRYAAMYQDEKTGQLVQSQALCKHRLCPKCNAIRAARVSANLEHHLEKINSPRMLTLTLDHRLMETAGIAWKLKDQVDHLVASWQRLRRSKAYQAKIKGGVGVIEIKWSNRDNAWHPHMHVLVDGQFWEQAQISRAWEIASKGSKIVDIRYIHDRSSAGRYVSKYVAKVGDVDGVPLEKIPELALALHGLRMVQTSGSLYGSTNEKKRPKRDEPLQFIAPLGPLVDAQKRGDCKAKRVIDALQQALRCKCPPGTDVLSPDDEQTSRTAGELLWDWWHEQTKDFDHAARTDVETPKRKHRPPDRAERLWQESEHEPGALAGGM